MMVFLQANHATSHECSSMNGTIDALALIGDRVVNSGMNGTIDALALIGDRVVNCTTLLSEAKGEDLSS